MQTEASPMVSIIVATYNAAPTLQRCLDSIFDQSFTSYEVLVSDGGSTDRTLEVLEANEPAIAHWESRPDEGIYDAWNRVLSRATGSYVCFLGADDAWVDSSALQALVDATAGGRFDLVSSQGLVTTPGSAKVVRFGSGWNYERLGRRMVLCHPGLLHARALFERFGSFDARYKIAGDLEFLLRLPKDISFLHVPRDTVLIGGAGVSRSKVLERLREQREILSRCPRYGPIRAYLAWLDKLWRLPVAQMLDISH